MAEDHLLYDVKDHVATITINRPRQRNAISPQTVALFLKYLDRAQTDAAVRVILVTGTGNRAFCAGADLGGAPGAEIKAAAGRYAALLKKLAGFPKPVVARVNGHCLAGGMGLMLACDIAIARDDAEFGTPEVNVGLWPMMIGALIYRHVLRKKALEMILLGRKIDAQQALEMGLITRAVPAEALDAQVARILASLAAKSPIGIKIGKQAFYAMQDMPFEAAVDFLADKLARLAATEDAQEGIAAFIEKRKPVFKGK